MEIPNFRFVSDDIASVPAPICNNMIEIFRLPFIMYILRTIEFLTRISLLQLQHILSLASFTIFGNNIQPTHETDFNFASDHVASVHAPICKNMIEIFIINILRKMEFLTQISLQQLQRILSLANFIIIGNNIQFGGNHVASVPAPIQHNLIQIIRVLFVMNILGKKLIIRFRRFTIFHFWSVS